VTSSGNGRCQIWEMMQATKLGTLGAEFGKCWGMSMGTGR